jgi:hypothetical protein
MEVSRAGALPASLATCPGKGDRAGRLYGRRLAAVRSMLPDSERVADVT